MTDIGEKQGDGSHVFLIFTNFNNYECSLLLHKKSQSYKLPFTDICSIHMAIRDYEKLLDLNIASQLFPIYYN